MFAQRSPLTAVPPCGLDERPGIGGCADLRRRSEGWSDWQGFRERLFASLDRVAEDRFVYIDEDRFVHVCPVCRADLPEYLRVHFHGRASRVELRCSLGCAPAELAAALGLRVRS